MKSRKKWGKSKATTRKNNRAKLQLELNLTPRAYLEFADGVVLENAATNTRDQLLIRLLRLSGCRISEALGLTVDNINFDNNTICIKHLKARIRLSCPHCGARLSRTSAFCSGCGRPVSEAVAIQKEQIRLRTIPVDRGTIDLLKYFIDHGGPVERDGKKWLFPINRFRAYGIVKQCADKAGLPRLMNSESGKLHYVSPHQLRDSFAIHAVKKNDSGDALRMLQTHLGHQNINTTMGYRKIAGEELKNWYQKLFEESNSDETIET
jgi:integrase/recombinase XerD